MIRIALLLLLGGGLFWSGLYAAGQQLAVTAGFALLALAAAGRSAWSWLEVTAALLLAAGAGLSLIQPASTGSSLFGPAVVAGYLLALVAGRLFSASEAAAGPVIRTLGRVWAGSAFVMVFAGIAAMSYLPVHHSNRLASLLGYPIAVGILGLLGLAGSLPDVAAGRWWAPLLAYGSGTGLFLSGSRGVWAAALLLAGYLWWAGPLRANRTGWKLGPPLAAALAAALWAGPAIAQRSVPGALAPFLIGSLTILLWQRFPLPEAARAGRLLLALGWGAALALAPGWPWLLGRATALTLSEGSWAERFTFMRDGLAMIRDYPLGAGYRAWTALHLQRASYAYYSAEVHSSLLDITLAFGWLGGLGFLLLLVRYFWRLARYRTVPAAHLPVLAGLGALGLHSLIDWDLSYGAFAGALWLGFGLMAPRPDGPRPDARLWRLPRRAVAAVAGAALAASLLLGSGAVFAELAQRALTAGRPEAAYRHAAMAAAVLPGNDLAHALAGQALRLLHRPDEALAAFDQARRLGPYEPWYAELEALTLMDQGRAREAAAHWREYVRLWPWESSAYEEALSAHLDLLLRAEVLGDAPLAQDLVQSGQAILAALDRQKASEPAHTPRRPMPTDTPIIRQARDRFRAGN